MHVAFCYACFRLVVCLAASASSADGMSVTDCLMPDYDHVAFLQGQTSISRHAPVERKVVLSQGVQQDKMNKFGDHMWLLAIPISLVGSTATVSGLLVQKMSHIPDEQQDGETKSGMFYFLDRMWIGGFALFVTGNLICWMALGMAPNSVLSCFNSWNVIFTFLIAPRWFPKCFTKAISSKSMYCAAFLVVGCCWVAVAGPRSYRLRTVEHLRLLFTYPAFHWCCVVVGIAYVASLARYCLHLVRVKNWDPLATAQISGVASTSAAYAVIFSKCTSSLVQTSFASHHNEVKQDFFIYLVLTAIFGALQIHFLNVALHHGEAAFVVPIYESSSMAMQIVVGGMLFQEYAHFTFAQHMVFWPGVVVVLIAVVALCRFAMDENEQEEKLVETER